MKKKFRYYVTAHENLCGRFLYSDQKSFNFLGDSVVIEGFATVNAANIQQWTGLVDKNGREIYEGDIVHRFGHCSLMPVPSIDEYKEIKWWSDGGRWNYTPYIDCSLEVVGNIFENPELVK